MVSFDLSFKDIILRVHCEQQQEYIIKEHMLGHAEICEPVGKPTYCLVSTSNPIKTSGIYIKFIDKWFDNAELDCWINNREKTCYISSIKANNITNANLLLQYFTSNLFARLLEIKGYIALHSSCATKDNKGISFIAPRNSGKTNCLINLMEAGFDSVTNEKLAIKYENGNFIGHSIAQDVSIRMSKEFRDQPSHKKYVFIAKKMGIKLYDKNKLEGNNIHIGSVKLAKMNRVKQIPSTIVTNFFVPEYIPGLKTVHFENLSSKHFLQTLITQHLPMVHDTTSFFSLIDIKEDALFNSHETLLKIAEHGAMTCKQSEFTKESFIKGIHNILELKK